MSRILVNGQPIPNEMIREESQRLGQTPEWQSIPESFEKSLSLRQAAEQCAIDRTLLLQEAEKDPRPIDPALLANELQRRAPGWSHRTWRPPACGCRSHAR